MIELRLLGGVGINATDGRNVEPLVRQSKPTAVLAYLAAALPRGFHRRDKLLAVFWPGSDERHARAALSQSLYVLRHTLGEQAVVTRGEVEVRLNVDVVWCDVAAFEAALDAGRPTEALALYRGELLDGFFVTGAPEFERWLDAERARLKQQASEGAWALAEAKAADGDLVEAERWARRAGDLLPDDEAVIRRLMTFLHRLGDRAAAIRAYEAFAWRLAHENELEPSAETQGLAAAIRREEGHPVAPRAAEPAIPSLSPIRTARRRVSTGWLAAVTLLGLAGLGTLGLLAVRSSGGSPAGRAMPEPAAYPRSAIAVLPFQNLSAEGSYAYFASGLHDEILTQLYKVQALKVISRTSVMSYRDPNRPSLAQLASELGVGSVVEASVQVVGNRVRANVQLIDAATGRSLWAERYERTLDDAFAVQSDIAQQIVSAVGGALTDEERAILAAAPTGNAEAYFLYLQGREYQTRPGYLRQNYEIGQQLFERALELDPEFALARAALSEVHGRMYWFRYDPSPARAARAMEEAEAALRLAPDLPQARLAMGVAHYQGRRDYQRALEEYTIALGGLPNDAELWARIGYVHRRLGNWDEALTAFEKATQLNPRDGNLLFDAVAGTLLTMHRYAEAVRAYDRVLTLAPDLHVAAVMKGWTYALWGGWLDTLRAVLRRVPPDADLSFLATGLAQQAQLLYWERRADSLLHILTTAPGPAFDATDFFLPTSLYAAWAHQLRGDATRARAGFDSARVLVDSVMAERPTEPREAWRLHTARGLALAGLGRRHEALGEARWLEQSMMYRQDALQGPLLVEGRARILAQAGEADAALDEIERLLKRPARFSVHLLRLESLWDPIREHPRFKALLAAP